MIQLWRGQPGRSRARSIDGLAAWPPKSEGCSHPIALGRKLVDWLDTTRASARHRAGALAGAHFKCSFCFSLACYLRTRSAVAATLVIVHDGCHLSLACACTARAPAHSCTSCTASCCPLLLRDRCVAHGNELLVANFPACWRQQHNQDTPT